MSLFSKMRRNVYDVLQNDMYESRLSIFVDYFLVILISTNVAAVMLESVDRVYYPNQQYFECFENFSVLIFTIEYLLRLWSVAEASPQNSSWRERWLWLKSPASLIDIVAIAPAFLNYFVSIDLRFLRILRLFRVFKLTRYFAAMRILLSVLHKQQESFKAVLFILMIMLVTASSGIYLVENQAQPEVFESIPQSLWWAVVTLTTVGYGDVVPVTIAGKIFGAIITILGVGLAALPAGIIASGLASELDQRREQLEQSFKEILLDHKLDLLTDHDEIVKLRRQIGLNVDQAKEIVEQVLREQEHEQKMHSLDRQKYCPHCGEHL